MMIAQAQLDQVASWITSGQRHLLGVVAPPGAGKSTFAGLLAQAFPGDVCVVPMDGFHLANSELARLGRANRKGASDTFDAAGYVNLLQRIRTDTGRHTIYAPDYRREVEEAVAGAIAVEPAAKLIITEGNYLLLPEEPWALVRQWVTEVWYLDVPDALRHQRLLERHMRYGRTHAEALAWIAQTDEPNAQRIVQTRRWAHEIVPWLD